MSVLVFALFGCQVTASTPDTMYCSPLSPSGRVFDTLKECQEDGRRSYPVQGYDFVNGRMVIIDSPDYKMWWECRSKRVETWEPAK